MGEKVKVVIEIPKDRYEWIMKYRYVTDYQTTEMLYDRVRKGTLLDECDKKDKEVKE